MFCNRWGLASTVLVLIFDNASDMKLFLLQILPFKMVPSNLWWIKVVWCGWVASYGILFFFLICVFSSFWPKLHNSLPHLKDLRRLLRLNQFWGDLTYLQWRSAPPRSSAEISSPVAAFTSGGPPRKMVPCLRTIIDSSAMAGT